MKIGIDFGTTNTTISYVENRVVKQYQMGGAGQDGYIPSWIAYPIEETTGQPVRTLQHCEIGHNARHYVTDPDYETYQCFKLFLGHDPLEQVTQWPGRLAPIVVAQDYLTLLLSRFQKEKQIDTIDKIVITMPLIWETAQPTAREQLKQIFENIGYRPEQIVLRSEPAAAVVYFAWKYQQRSQKTFNGQVLVVDYGGGTLDVSVAEVDGLHIHITHQSGQGDIGHQLGQAGVGFDQAVYAAVHPTETELAATKQAWLIEFERKKIAFTEKITQSLIERLDLTRQPKLFHVGTQSVTTDQLITAFQDVNEAALKQALAQVATALPQDRLQADHFRILLVGGFSQFCLVRKTVCDFLGIRYDPALPDPRFDTGFEQAEGMFAIANGAALVANHLADIKQSMLFEVGIVGFLPRPDKDEKRYWPIIKQGTPQPLCVQPIYRPHPFIVVGAEPALIFYLRGPSLPTLEFDMQKKYGPAHEWLPDFNPQQTGETRFNIGFSVDTNMQLFLYIRNERTQQVKQLSLGDMLLRARRRMREELPVHQTTTNTTRRSATSPTRQALSQTYSQRRM